MATVTSPRRRELRAKAHALHPVVIIGHQGLTPAVIHEIDINLQAHELIKVRVFNDDRDEREAMLQRICNEMDAAPIQHIGKLLVLWRKNLEQTKPSKQPVVRQPILRARKAAGDAPATERATANRTGTGPRSLAAASARDRRAGTPRDTSSSPRARSAEPGRARTQTASKSTSTMPKRPGAAWSNGKPPSSGPATRRRRRT